MRYLWYFHMPVNKISLCLLCKDFLFALHGPCTHLGLLLLYPAKFWEVLSCASWIVLAAAHLQSSSLPLVLHVINECIIKTFCLNCITSL